MRHVIVMERSLEVIGPFKDAVTAAAHLTKLGFRCFSGERWLYEKPRISFDKPDFSDVRMADIRPLQSPRPKRKAKRPGAAAL